MLGGVESFCAAANDLFNKKLPPDRNGWQAIGASLENERRVNQVRDVAVRGQPWHDAHLVEQSLGDEIQPKKAANWVWGKCIQFFEKAQ